MSNLALMNNATTADFISRGFVKTTDGTDSPWGVSYDLKTSSFEITIDCTWEVKLARRNPDHDHIQVVVEDLHDLDCLVDWVAE